MNKMMKLNLRHCRIGLPLVAVALFGGVNVASAATFQYSSYSLTNGQDISIYSPTHAFGEAGGITLIGSGANAGQDILAWCLDVYDSLDNSGHYSIGSLTNAGVGGSNPSLSNTQIGEIGSLIEHGDAIINSSYNVSAAIQVAIWDIEYGRSFGYNGISSAVTDLANTYVTDVKTGIWDTPDYNVSLLSESYNQDLAYVTTTPLPSTWTLMLIGLAGLGFFAYSGTKNRFAAAAAA
jgi:hypothetical protein